VTEAEAKARCAQLAQEHPDRATANWIPIRQKDGFWAVARIGLPPPLDPAATEKTRDSSRPVTDNPGPEPPWINPP
jgi:hypothetical protein